MTVLGIDPSIRATGLAWRPPRLPWRTFLERGDDRPRIRKIIALAASQGVKVAYIEAAFVGPNRKVSLHLAALGGEMRAWCITCGMDFHMIQANDWRKSMLGNYEKGTHKEASIRLAEELGADIHRYGRDMEKIKDHNLADAVCLSEYGRLQNEEGMKNDIYGNSR